MGMYSSRMPWVAGGENQQQNLHSRPWQSYPGATRTSGWLRSGAGRLDSQRSSSDSLLFLCQTPLGMEKSLPIRNLEGTRFALWHLHCVYFSIWLQASPLASRTTMLSRPLLVYRYIGKQKEMWPRPVKDALLKMCFSTWQGVWI